MFLALAASWARAMTLVAVLSLAPSAVAQPATAADNSFTMMYQDAERSFKLIGEVVQNSGETVLSLSSREPEGSDESIVELPGFVPDWEPPKTTTASAQELVFEHKELVAIVQGEEARYFVDGKVATQEAFLAEHWVTSGQSSKKSAQRTSLSHFIQMLGGAVGKRGAAPLYLGGLHIPGDGRSILQGLKLRLFNPQSVGRTTTWDWEAQIGFDGAFGPIQKFSGSAELQNPIVWGAAPRIEQILVASAQKAVTGTPLAPVYPKVEEGSVERVDDSKSQPHLRELIVIARDLEIDDAETVTSQTDGITYSSLEVFEPGWVRERLSNLAPEAVSETALSAAQDAQADDDLKVYWVTATISEPIETGVVDLHYGKASGEWPLLYGDLNGLIAIVRPDTSELLEAGDAGNELRSSETTSRPLYFRDEIVFQAELNNEIDRETLAIDFAGGNVSLASEARAGASLEISLNRVAGKPRTYRSQSYVLADKETYRDFVSAEGKETGFLKLDADDTMDSIMQSTGGTGEKVRLAKTDAYDDLPAERTLLLAENEFLRPRFSDGNSKIEQIPPSGDAQVVKADDTVSGDFIAALREAAKCADRYGTTDWDKLSVEEEEAISGGTFVASHGVPITFGQHAAMLMVRGKFVDTLNSHITAIDGLLDQNGANPAFARAAESVWRGEPSFITLLARSQQNSLAAKIRQRKASGDALRGADGSMSADVAGDIRDFLATQREAIVGTRSNLNLVSGCDVKRLLEITGKGFSPIIDVLKSTVTRVQTNGRTNARVRRPDMVARRALDSLIPKLAEFDTVSVYGKAQWATLNGIVSTVGIASGVGAAYYGASYYAGLALAANSADFAYTCADNYCGSMEDYSNLTIAKGATGVLGDSYLTEAERLATSPLRRMFEVGWSGLALHSGVKSWKAGNPAEVGIEGLRKHVKSLDKLGDIRDARTIVDFVNGEN
ncbi:hypothetical protein [Hoeflea phototrophica]|uniref:hypothetical protein n=1 Tax=Hoeflea phototrophica TaxID=244596 RepID=UPI0012EB13C6|nr:hypothetical protein [Hoeflea phototrophica]